MRQAHQSVRPHLSFLIGVCVLFAVPCILFALISFVGLPMVERSVFDPVAGWKAAGMGAMLVMIAGVLHQYRVRG